MHGNNLSPGILTLHTSVRVSRHGAALHILLDTLYDLSKEKDRYVRYSEVAL